MEVLLGFIAGTIATALIGWLANYFAPGVFFTLARRPAVRVHVELDPANIYAGFPNWIGSGWVLPAGLTPDQIGSPPTAICRDWRPWMERMGACDAHRTEVQVTLQGAAPSTVTVTGLRVDMVRSDPVGTHLGCAVGGASVQNRSLHVDLDWPPGLVTYSDEDGGPAPLPTFTLRNGEIEVFHIVAETQSLHCEWTAQLLLIIDGKRLIVDIDDEGQPFRTSGTEGLPAWLWTGAGWQTWL